MPVSVPLYQQVLGQITTITDQQPVRITSVRRLALLVTGIIAAQSCVLAQVAAELAAVQLTQATSGESIARRLRRALNDPALTPQTCDEPVVGQGLDWAAVRRGRRQVVLIVEESTKADEVHLFRVSLASWGGALPLAWAVWPQNQPLPAGHYWATIEAVLGRVAALLPAGVAVIVVADRAYDVPDMVDRIAARGWHWVVRCTAKGSLRFRDQQGQVQPLAAPVACHLPTPGHRWKARGWVFKDAGWRAASVVGVWALGQAEPLVVLTDLPAQWAVLRLYTRRSWTEPGFRKDKSRGWPWEASPGPGVEHHARRLGALAWASLVMRCLGVQAASERVAALGARPMQRRAGAPRLSPPQHARESVFTLGLRRARQWLYQAWAGVLPWRLPDLDGTSWTDRWRFQQAYRLIFQTVRP